MAEETPTNTSDSAARKPAHAGGAYVRPQRPRRTVEPVDDLAADEAEASINYHSDSDFQTNSFAPLSGSLYRDAQQDLKRIQTEGNTYGKYLEIPKGHRSIFVRNERAERMRTIITVSIVLVVFVVLALVLWEFIGPMG